jgi:hypothetical protein
MWESQLLFLKLRLVSEENQQSAIQTIIEHHFGGFFSTNKKATANRKKGFKTNRDPNKQEVGVIFGMKRLRTLNSFKYSRSKFKKSKTYSG